MLIAWAFLCAVGAQNCEREAIARGVVGEGPTPIGCMIDGWEGVAKNQAFEHDDKFTVVVSCRRKQKPD